MSSVQYSCSNDIFDCCQNLYELCQHEIKVLDTKDEESNETLHDQSKQIRGRKSRKVRSVNTSLLIESDLQIPEIFKYRKELAYLYVKDIKIQKINEVQTVSVIQYNNLSNIFSVDKVIPLCDEEVVISKSSRRVYDSINHINKLLLPSCVIGCMFMREDALIIRLEDGLGGFSEYVYGEDIELGFELTKYIELLFNSLVKVDQDLERVYWLTKGNMKSCVVRNDEGSTGKIVTIF